MFPVHRRFPYAGLLGNRPFQPERGQRPAACRYRVPKNAVTGVTEAGDDIAVLVEMGIDGGRIDVHVRVRFFNALDAFGGAYEVEAEDALAAALFEEVNRGDERSAGRQHGVKDDGDALVDLLGELHVVFHGLQRLFIPVQADDAVFSRRGSCPARRP